MQKVCSRVGYRVHQESVMLRSICEGGNLSSHHQSLWHAAEVARVCRAGLRTGQQAVKHRRSGLRMNFSVTTT